MGKKRIVHVELIDERAEDALRVLEDRYPDRDVDTLVSNALVVHARRYKEFQDLEPSWSPSQSPSPSPEYISTSDSYSMSPSMSPAMTWWEAVVSDIRALWINRHWRYRKLKRAILEWYEKISE